MKLTTSEKLELKQILGNLSITFFSKLFYNLSNIGNNKKKISKKIVDYVVYDYLFESKKHSFFLENNYVFQKLQENKEVKKLNDKVFILLKTWFIITINYKNEKNIKLLSNYICQHIKLDKVYDEIDAIRKRSKRRLLYYEFIENLKKDIPQDYNLIIIAINKSLK